MVYCGHKLIFQVFQDRAVKRLRGSRQFQKVKISDFEQTLDLFLSFFLVEIPIRERFDEERGHPFFDGSHPQNPILLFGNQ